MTSRDFGTLDSGEKIEIFKLANGAGASMEVMTYGGIVRSINMPDRAGNLVDVVLGRDTLKEYTAGHPFFGAVAGRIAGRIFGGRISVAGSDYTLNINRPPHHVHGGRVGFDKQVWVATPQPRADGADSLQLRHTSPAGAEGYPGEVEVAITYTLTARNEFCIDTFTTADRPTPLSLTHHGYFNLGGEGAGDIGDHDLQVFADEFVPVDHALSLTGRREPVGGTVNDFRAPRSLGHAVPELYKNHGALYILPESEKGASHPLRRAARLVHRESGRVLEVATNERCLQLYTASAFDGTTLAKGGRSYVRHAGVCLECEGYPEATTTAGFGDLLVTPARPQARSTIYAFSTL